MSKILGHIHLFIFDKMHVYKFFKTSKIALHYRAGENSISSDISLSICQKVSRLHHPTLPFLTFSHLPTYTPHPASNTTSLVLCTFTLAVHLSLKSPPVQMLWGSQLSRFTQNTNHNGSSSGAPGCTNGSALHQCSRYFFKFIWIMCVLLKTLFSDNHGHLF